MYRRNTVATVLFLFCLIIVGPGIAQAAQDHIRGKPILTGTWKGIEGDYLAGEIQVKIASGAESDQVDSLLGAHDCFVIYEFVYSRWGLVGCDTTADIFDKIESLSASPLIECAEPNGIVEAAVTPSDTLFDPNQWYLDTSGDTVRFGAVFVAPSPDADIDAVEGWDLETGSTDVLVAVLDSGIPTDSVNTDSLNHPDLSDPDKYILGWNHVHSTDNVRDFGGHGTTVTGILAAMTNNVEGIAGVCWGCRVLVEVVVGGTEWALVCGIRHAAQQGAQVMNASVGTPYWYSQNMEDAVAEAGDSNSLIVAAVGNRGNTQILSPAGYASYGTDPDHLDGYRNVIAVGGSDQWDNKWSQGCYSNDSLKTTVVASAVKIFSTLPPYNWWGHGSADSVYGHHHDGCGTSLSTPQVAGIAGLLLSHESSLEPDSIRTIIENTADDVETPGWDTLTGYGRVNALRALMAVDGYYPNATGYVRTNTTWGDTLGDTLYVLGDVVIPEGCTLTIDDGAVIKFLTNDREDFGIDSTKCEIIVEGALVVNGTVNDSVWLMSDGATPSDSDWYGITVDSTGSIDLEYCVIQDALQPVLWDSASTYGLNHVRFKHCHTWVTVDSSETLSLSNCAFEDFPIAITVNSSGTLDLDACDFVDGDTAIVVNSGGSTRFEDGEILDVHTGVVVKSGGSAMLFDSDIKDVTKGINFANTASDTVSGCTFLDNLTHGIYVSANDNLLVDDCTFVDSTVSSDSGVYGIRSKSDITVTNSVFDGYKYGIKCQQTSTIPIGPSAPTIRECGFTNMDEVGIISSFSDPTIKRCCFKGSYGEACIRVDGGDPDIDSCYLYSAGDGIPIGILFTFGAGGTVRRTEFHSYDSCAVQIKGTTTEPNFGDSNSHGDNYFQKPDTTNGEYYFISECTNTIKAEYNHWVWTNADLIERWISGDVDVRPVNIFWSIILAPDICSEISGKIAVESEEEKGEEKETEQKLSENFVLSQNYPNPFNPQTVIKYSLRQPAHVELTIYNALGQKVRRLVDQLQIAGQHTVIWEGENDNGEEVASGVYLFRLKAGDFQAVKRMVLLR